MCSLPRGKIGATLSKASKVGARRHSAQLAEFGSEFGGCVNPSKIRGGNTAAFDSMIGMLGSTPVLSLSSLVQKLSSLRDCPAHKRPDVLVKLESTNPGWSVKARPAVHMLEQAERRGDIKPGTVIIESSSGNTAIAMAMVSAMKGYHFKPVVDIKMPQGKLDLLRVFGADVELVGDPNIPPDEQDMVQLKKDRRATVARLVAELGDRAYSPNQYANPDNAGSHVLSTGPELLEQLNGDIDALILPISTGGQVRSPPTPSGRPSPRLSRRPSGRTAAALRTRTERAGCESPCAPLPLRGSQINGIGRFIKEHLPECQLIGTEPIGSTILQEGSGDYYNAGSGLDYAPVPVEHMLADRLIDHAWAIPDAASFKTSRLLAKTTGALMGPTTGMQVFAALALAIENPGMGNIAVVGCDDGRAYVPDM